MQIIAVILYQQAKGLIFVIITNILGTIMWGICTIYPIPVDRLIAFTGTGFCILYTVLPIRYIKNS